MYRSWEDDSETGTAPATAAPAGLRVVDGHGAGGQLECRQRQRQLHQSAVLRRVLRSGPDPRRRLVLHDRYHHARGAGPAAAALARPGELGVRLVCDAVVSGWTG